MAFWIGLAVLGFVVTVLFVESHPVRSRLEKWSGGGGGGLLTPSYIPCIHTRYALPGPRLPRHRARARL